MFSQSAGRGASGQPLRRAAPPAIIRAMSDPDLSHLAREGALIALRVTPRARRNAITLEGELIRCHVTAAPEDGKANHAVIRLLAKSLGVAKSRLTLLRGATSRDKVFRLD